MELEAVVAVARCRNFRLAAAELGRSRSAVSHAVAALEQRLRVRLFNRTTRSVSLTEAGEVFVTSVASALAEIHAAFESASSRRTSLGGTLRIKTFDDVAREMIAPIVLQYLRRYPEMKIDVVTSGRPIDIVVDGFDAGVQRADDVPDEMIAVPLSYELPMAVVGSLAYLENKRKPRVPKDLLVHRCIRLRLPSGTVVPWKFERHGKSINIEVAGPLTLDDPAFVLDAARAGVGLAYLRESIAAADLAHGRLVRVLEDWTRPFPGICLYYPGRRNIPARLRALVDLIHDIGVQSEA
ncbi:MAG: LysR family transcriptional regulator [Xanthobacteraceae bacterium]